MKIFRARFLNVYDLAIFSSSLSYVVTSTHALSPTMVYRYRVIILISIGGLIVTGLLFACVVSYQNTITPDGIIVHHSAVTFTQEGNPVDLKVLDNAHRRRGFDAFYWGRTYHVGYHYVIFPDGKVELGRPERCVGAHAAGHNSAIGICLVGDFSSAGNPAGEQGAL